MEKNKNGIIIMLVALVIILAVLCTLFATGTIDLKNEKVEINENSITVKNYTFADVVGIYEATYNVPGYDVSDECFTTMKISLNLYDNGIFRYVGSTCAPFGSIGNYIVKDNKIILNYLYNTNSGVALDPAKGTKELLIEDDGSLKDSNPSITVKKTTKQTEIKLSKTSNSINDNFDFNNFIETVRAMYDRDNYKLEEPAM